MRKIFLYFSLLLFMQTAFAADSLFVRKPQIPILIDRTDNILVEMRVQAHKGDVLNKLSLQFKEGIDLNDIKALRFFYSGTEATSRQGKHYRPVSYISSHAEGKTKAANPAYSIKQSEVTDIQYPADGGRSQLLLDQYRDETGGFPVNDLYCPDADG